MKRLRNKTSTRIQMDALGWTSYMERGWECWRTPPAWDLQTCNLSFEEVLRMEELRQDLEYLIARGWEVAIGGSVRGQRLYRSSTNWMSVNEMRDLSAPGADESNLKGCCKLSTALKKQRQRDGLDGGGE